MRLCDICGKEEAIFTITEVDKEGKTKELHLCLRCAEKKGLLDKDKISLAELFAHLLKERVREEDRRLLCSNCGLSYADFKKRGRLGCEECYTAFESKLTGLIKRIHGTTLHTGKIPSVNPQPLTREIEMRKLRERLKQAIDREEYEEAARIRDEMKRLGVEDV